MTSKVNKQRGGVLAFVLVGGVLLALLAGGIYASKNQSRLALNNSTTTPTQQENKPAEQPKNDNKQPTPAEKPKAPAENTPRQATPAPSAPTNNTPRQQNQGIANTGPSAIASTGPADILLSAVGLGAVTAGISAYRRSSTRMHRAALK